MHWAGWLCVMLTACGGAVVSSSDSSGADEPASLHACAPLTATTTVEYDATAADGRRFYVVHPTKNYGYEDFRVFFGTPDAMLERKTFDVTRTKSGRTTMSFLVDGVTYEAAIGSPMDATQDHASTLAFGGQTEALELSYLNRAGSGVGLTFECL